VRRRISTRKSSSTTTHSVFAAFRRVHKTTLFAVEISEAPRFCSRDCLYLHDIYRQLFEDDSLYLYTSRLSRIKCSPDYESYVRKKITGDHVVVDMCGTGWSLGALLYQRLGISTDHAASSHFRLPPTAKPSGPYDAIRQYTPPDKLEYIIWRDRSQQRAHRNAELYRPRHG